MHKTSEPKWLEQFELYATDEGQTLQLAVFHNSFTGKDLLIGNCDVPLDSLAHGRTEDIWTKLQNTDMGEIHLLLTIVWDKDEPDSILANRTMVRIGRKKKNKLKHIFF